MNYLKQAVIMTGGDPCFGCCFKQSPNCREEAPSDCIEDDQHFIFQEDGKIDSHLIK